MSETFFCFSCGSYKPVGLRVDQKNRRPVCSTCIKKIERNSRSETDVHTVIQGKRPITVENYKNQKYKRTAKRYTEGKFPKTFYT